MSPAIIRHLFPIHRHAANKVSDISNAISNADRHVRTTMQGKNTSRPAVFRSPSMLLVCVVLFFGISCGFFPSHTAYAFNLDTQQPVKYTGPRGSYFGYSVLLHENTQGKWVLAGAPRDWSDYQPTLQTPGALYKCLYNNVRQSCRQVKIDNKGNEMSAPNERPYVLDAKDNQWLGVSLARQNIGKTGKVTTCAHRWANHYFKETNKVILPNGACFTMEADMEFETINKMRPCMWEVQIKADQAGRGIAWHGWCQAGFSAKYTDDGSTLILGAVGSLAWRGSTVSITDGASRVSDVTSWFPSEEEDESYIGYAVSSGHFLDRVSVEGVTGAPRAYEKGKVYIYDLVDFTLLAQIEGEHMNTYFGAAVLAIDLNHDGLSDLLVGAPLYSVNQDEGCVYIYMNVKRAVLQRNDVMLSGSNQLGSRFGSSIELAGDLNKDNFMDVVIGAPYEDDGSGAVYIYHGSQFGLRTQYVQRIAGKSVDPGLKSFGSSISALVDVDGNNYTDLLIGAYENDTAVLYLSRPIVAINAFMAISRSPIDLNRTECNFEGKKVPCVRAMVCFMYMDTAPSTIAIDYILDTEYYKTQSNLPPRMQFVEKGLVIGTKVTRNTVLHSKQQQCFEIQGHIQRDLKDYLSPVPFRLHYQLRTRDNTQVPPVTFCAGLCPVLDYYAANDIVEQVRFIHNCGNDSVCETDLQLTADIILPRGTPYLPLGTEEILYVSVDLRNHGEEAHMTQVLVTFPKEVTFVRVENIANQETLVLCYPTEAKNLTSSVLCEVDNPMRANSKSLFRLRLSVESIGRRSPNIDISVHASTTSLEHNNTLSDNFVFISMPVRIEADITISGVTHPEQVLYGALRQLDKDTSTEGIQKGMEGTLDLLPTMNPKLQEVKSKEAILDERVGPKFRHIYDARNLGPSELPFPMVVNISLPWKTHDGQWLLYFTNILFQGTGRCEYNHIIKEQHAALSDYLSNKTTTGTSKEHSRVASFFESKPKTLTCSVMKCVTISCIVENLVMGEGAVIEIQARLFERTFVENDLGIVAVVAEAKVSVEDPFQKHIQPANGRPDEIKVSTLAYTDQNTNIWRVPRWAVALSIAIGILVLIAVSAVMWKCGFFKRPMREEMERLIQEKDETETLYPDGIWDHPYDDPPDHFTK